MNVTFSNGNSMQQGVVQYVIDNLLHLDLGRFNFDLIVEFVDNPEPSIHNEFAFTEGDPPIIQLRSDFPSFAPLTLWGSIEFAKETVAHELAHALLGQIPQTERDEILALFDSTQAEMDADGDREWVDRIREGIAETFKDAFLRKVDRRYPNRTNVKLPYSRFPAFREIWRGDMVGSGEPETRDYASWNVYNYPYQDPIDPVGVYRWVDLSTHGPDLSGNPDESLPGLPDGWTNPMDYPAGQEDWTITLPWEYTQLIDRPGPFGMLGIPEGGFGWQLVTSDRDNVDPPFGLPRQAWDVPEPDRFDPLPDLDPPREGWVTWWAIWMYAFSNVTSLQTAWSMHVHGWYAPGGDMDATWPATDYFPGYPKIYHTFLPDMGGFLPGWTGPDPTDYGDAEEYIFVPYGDPFPGTLELPVKTPPLPAYLGMDWNYGIGFYSYPFQEVHFPYGMTAEIPGGLSVEADAPIPAASVAPGRRRGGAQRLKRRVVGA